MAAKDVAGPQLSKEVVKTANMVLNQAILDHYHTVSQARARGNLLIFLPQELLGGGTWISKAKKKMKEKYYVTREQHVRMEPPCLKVGALTFSLFT